MVFPFLMNYCANDEFILGETSNGIFLIKSAYEIQVNRKRFAQLDGKANMESSLTFEDPNFYLVNLEKQNYE